MNQEGIKKKLALYLKYCAPEETKTLRRLLNKEGHCFGFALSYVGMFFAGKIKWWEAALESISLWDETIEGLNKIVKLPESNNPFGEKLENIFFKVLNFVVPNQADESAGLFRPKGIHQLNILYPENKFRIINHENKVLSIAWLERIAGFFGAEDLEYLFSDIIENNICLLHNNNHTIGLIFDGVKWILYDANYHHNGVDKTAKSYPTKIKLIEEVFSILGHTLSIEIAYFVKPKQIPKSPFNIFYEKNIQDIHKVTQFLSGEGLHIIAYHCPDKLDKLLQQAQLDRRFVVKLGKILSKRDRGSWTGLHILVSYSPMNLTRILHIIKKHKKGPRLLSQALRKKSVKKTGLYHVVINVPDLLPLCLNLMGECASAYNNFVNCLQHSCDGTSTGLQILIEYASNYLPMLFDYFKQFTQGPAALLIAFNARDEDAMTGLDYFVKKCLVYLPGLIDLVSQEKDLSELFLAMLYRNNGTNRPVAEILNGAPDCIQNIFSLLTKYPSLIEQNKELIKYIFRHTHDKNNANQYLQYILMHFQALNLDLYDYLLTHVSTQHLCVNATLFLKQVRVTQQIHRLIKTIEPTLRFDSLQWNKILTQAQIKMSQLILKQICQPTEEDRQFLQRQSISSSLFFSSVNIQPQSILHSPVTSSTVGCVK